MSGRQVRVLRTAAFVMCACLLFAAVVGHRRAAYRRYSNPEAIAEALQSHGIECTYSPSRSDVTGVESSGQCKGGDYIALIFVFPSAAERESAEQYSARYWCDHGATAGSYVSNDRWLVTLDAPQTHDPHAVYMRDIAAAAGGERHQVDCG